MPALTMRGRYLMREYWSDSDLFLRLTSEERELYQGLWMLADDEGWLVWDVPGIAAAIYHFMDRAPREAKVRTGVTKLARIGKVKRFKCCIFMAAVARYPRAGKKSTIHKDEHQLHSKGFKPSGPDGFKPIQTDLNPPPVVIPSLPDVAPARAPRGAAVAANGVVDWGDRIAELQARGAK